VRVSSSSWEEKVGRHLVCAIKVGPNGEVDHIKAGLVAKGYT